MEVENLLLVVCRATSPRRPKARGGYVGDPSQPQQSLAMRQTPFLNGLVPRTLRRMQFWGAELAKIESWCWREGHGKGSRRQP
jgi:hypothetical protein